MDKKRDLISRAAAIEWFFRPYSNEEYYSNLDVERALNAIPAVDAVPIVRAKWVEEIDHSYHWFCSNCKQVWGMTKYFMKYCPNCGALMNLEE